MIKCDYCGKLPYLCKCKKVEHIEETVSLFFYLGEQLKTAVYAVKKANLYYINEFFAKGMYNSIKSSDRIKLGDIDFITYIPRMEKSVRKYGYNQTEVLAGLISKYSGIPRLSVLKSAKSYKNEQKTLSPQERLLNVKNKFTVGKNKKENVKNKNILIIDDVVTTGATLSECARVIKDSGGNKIYALCAASVIIRSK
jgi:competence protein ComFC